MATREITGIRRPAIGRSALLAVLAMLVGLTATILVAVAIAFGPTATSGSYTLTLADDWGTRHPAAPAAVPLGPQDDYGLRHPYSR